jgi:hypothetical protein
MKGNAIHYLKTWPAEYEAMMLGLKTFELRKNDRQFRVGDILSSQEYDPSLGPPEGARFTGRSLSRRVIYILAGGKFGLHDDLVVMSLGPV